MPLIAQVIFVLHTCIFSYYIQVMYIFVLHTSHVYFRTHIHVYWYTAKIVSLTF